ncbi:RagB/SusD family nutrient uptake outer membrane protein [Sphingobacterium sp. HMA12]|uniref:RagB/SusD family nutrient uptake outer membrane protein n=1 Tax=Sphingobacterium sp. HMA12 TaxID=2050894 RepID=UPI000CE9B78B|nr:RagB/SusD family nutrient uptake outer membrane protein [Sphingobacterium sp. HMA12]
MKANKSFRGIYFSIFMLVIAIFINGCDKFLSEKPDKSLAIPSTLKDLQALLDNKGALTSEPNTGEISSGDFYLQNSDWTSLSSEANRRAYIWEKDYLFLTNAVEWQTYSTAVYYCNSVLEGLEGVARTGSNSVLYDNIKGQALFFRAKNMLAASGIWCLAYDESTASSDLGLPLRVNTNFNEPSVRSSLRQTYEHIISDLKNAVLLLPVIPVSYVRPSKPGAFACLSRTFLAMRRYEEANVYADSCLQHFDALIDYNTLASSKATYPFVSLNNEVLSEAGMAVGQILNLTRARVVDELYNQYDNDDLRKTLFFTNNSDGSHGFKGRYSGGTSLFSGFATDEVILTRAECLVRTGNRAEALKLLNRLLITRWKKGTFSAITAASDNEALEIILSERRKELLFRGLRWIDLKRLNKEGRNITIRRQLNGQEYMLPSNDLRYALPIPEDVVELSGMQQNPR